MRELKRLFIGVLALTFVGGIGLGAWVGTLTAAPRFQERDLDRRVQDFTDHFDLNESQIRQLRAILYRHDKAVAKIQERMTAQERRDTWAQEDASRERIRNEVLTPAQREEYDRLRKRK